MSSTRASLTRMFLDSEVEAGEPLKLPEEEAHHVLKVLRGRSGDTFEVVDSSGSLFAAEFRSGREAVVLEEISVSAGDGVEVVLYQAVPKGKHMELVVEKATELGVGRIVPLTTERGVVEAGESKVERWRRVALAAARQSLQLRVPEVTEPASFDEAVREAGGGGVLLHNEDGLPALEDVVESSAAALFVGPEGGWSEGELELAADADMVLAQLGPYRLRSETAGVVAVARARAALERRAERPATERVKDRG